MTLGSTVLVGGGWQFLIERIARRLEHDGFAVRAVTLDDTYRGAGLGRRRVEAIVLIGIEPFLHVDQRLAEQLVEQAEAMTRPAVASDVEVVVTVSSSLFDKADPRSPFVELARQVEERADRLARSGARHVTLRVPHVYGAGSTLFQYVADGVLPFSGDLSAVASHLHVDDAARAVSRAIRSWSVGVLKVADTHAVSWGEVLDYLQGSVMGLQVHHLAEEHRIRAERWLEGWMRPMPSAITPGTGWGLSGDQDVDPSPGVATLAMGLRYPTYRTGFDAVLAEIRAGGGFRLPNAG